MTGNDGVAVRLQESYGAVIVQANSQHEPIGSNFITQLAANKCNSRRLLSRRAPIRIAASHFSHRVSEDVVRNHPRLRQYSREAQLHQRDAKARPLLAQPLVPRDKQITHVHRQLCRGSEHGGPKELTVGVLALPKLLRHALPLTPLPCVAEGHRGTLGRNTSCGQHRVVRRRGHTLGRGRGGGGDQHAAVGELVVDSTVAHMQRPCRFVEIPLVNVSLQPLLRASEEKPRLRLLVHPHSVASTAHHMCIGASKPKVIDGNLRRRQVGGCHSWERLGAVHHLQPSAKDRLVRGGALVVQIRRDSLLCKHPQDLQ